MKVLPTARILLVDSQKDRREATRLALSAFGVGDVLEAETLKDATAPAFHNAADVLVVQADDPEQIPENPYRDGAGVPAILVAEAPPQMLSRASGRGGYDAALGAPLAPRLLYRRIGSVLQRARRTGRAAAPNGPADSPGAAMDLAAAS